MALQLSNLETVCRNYSSIIQFITANKNLILTRSKLLKNPLFTFTSQSKIEQLSRSNLPHLFKAFHSKPTGLRRGSRSRLFEVGRQVKAVKTAFVSPSGSLRFFSISSPSSDSTGSNYTSTTRKIGWENETLDQTKERSEWVSWFTKKKLSRNSCQVSFSRSSGAGGQHVNKVETKALIKLDLSIAIAGGNGWNRCRINGDEEEEEIGNQPGWLLSSIAMRLIETSKYYVSSSNTLQISSMKSRSKEQNLEDAFVKLHEHILDTSSESLPSSHLDPLKTEKQKNKVQNMKSKENRKMRKVKERRGGVKTGRKGGKGDLGW